MLHVSVSDQDSSQAVESMPTLKEDTGTRIFNNGEVICFLSQEAPLSNWYNSPMTIEDTKYSCVEQFFMAEKAESAKAYDLKEKIMATSDPNLMKRLGNKIKETSESWNDVECMKIGINAKFDQNTGLKDYLIATKDAKLCEASTNVFWGIGIHITSKDLYKTEKWLENRIGQNVLGELLMAKRQQLISNQ